MSLRHAIEESLALMPPEGRRRVDIAVDLPGDDAVVFETVRLEQIIVNLLRNALDALADRDDGAILIQGEHRGECVVLSITDNGGGIPLALREQIFDPFFTTKPDGKGLGLGLSISAAIARDFGASLALVEAPPGQTVFEVSLLAAKAMVTA